MESGLTNEPKPAVAETENVMKTNSADSFQSYIYELFEKNGILTDLRAYLRGHIANVLKSAHTGEPPLCQKNFIQRLDLTYQAMNILIAEYLIRLEFSYTFSVFVSEIPLANMVFGFAKSLMEKTDENQMDIRFQEPDIWSILNYLGVPCDSQHATNIVQMYNNEKQHPLLLCILKTMPMFKEFVKPPESLSEDSVASSKSLDSAENDASHKNNLSVMPECCHWTYCKNCQYKAHTLKEKYKTKIKCITKDINKNKENTNIDHMKSRSLIKNISIMEKGIIEEMFQQLKSVYETEVEMVKEEENKKVKRSMATHAIQLQQKQNELEETFKAREVEMERSVQRKKKFLWGLARSLRDQHQHMTRAMHEVRAETERLELKENSLKTQLAEAEQILKKRGEEMRLQITNELTILEGHLESMKRERENISRQRSELEDMKIIQDSTSQVIKTPNTESEEAIHSHYNLLQNELAILKLYLESSRMQPKCVIERATITEESEPVSQTKLTLNNSQVNEKCSKTDEFDGRLKMNQVVNDFRKKNVNFSQSNLDEIYRERSRERSQSSNSSEVGDTAAPDLDLETGRDRDFIQRLMDENDRLKAFVRQRRARASPAPRPHTAPPTPAHAHVPPAHAHAHVPSLNTSVSSSTLNVGWRKGAGEELSIFSNAQPRILVPGDTLPFIGVLKDKHGNSRRPAPGRARALAGVSKRATSPFRERHAVGVGSSAQGGRAHVPVASSSLQPDHDTYQPLRDRLPQRPRPALSLDDRKRDKSPKALPKEAKDKLRRDKGCTELLCDKSPSAVVREAKQRLRKLEIEAEAVEKSYIDFQRRKFKRDDLARELVLTRSQSTQELDATTKNSKKAQFADIQKSMRGDFDKYIHDYMTKFNIGETHFRNPIVAERSKPIPDTYIVDSTDHVDAHGNYLETPLIEFRKLYTCSRHTRRDDTGLQSPTKSTRPVNERISKTEFDYENSTRNDALRQVKHNKLAKLQKLKQNVDQIYHLPNNNNDFAATTEKQVNQNYLSSAEDENKLRVEVESIGEIHDIKSQTEDLLLVLQSSVNSREVTMSGIEVPSELFSAQMTIIVSPKRPESVDDGGLCVAPVRPRRSLSPEQRRRSLSPEQHRRSQSPEQHRRSQSPEHHRRSLSPEQHRRSLSPEHHRRSLSPEQHRRSQSPEQLRRSLSPEQHRRSMSPEHHRRSLSPEQHRRSLSPEQHRRSLSPEQAAHLTRNDVLDAIFHADPNNEISSVQMQLELSKDKDDSNSEYNNYNSHSDGENSPISVAGMTEDDNFWEA